MTLQMGVRSLAAAWGVVSLLTATTAGAHGGTHETASAKSGGALAIRETVQADGLLVPDEAWFWNGETLDGQVSSETLCDVNAPCPTYPIEVAAGGARLRVGIDTPERTDTLVIDVIDPSGAIAASNSTSNQFNSEALVMDPQPGTWTVRVRPESATNASYRLRAKLESVLVENILAAGPRHAMLPNLRTVPPYEFTFVAPANPMNGLYPPDTVNPPLEVAGNAPLSCTADEMAPVEAGGGGAIRCLRFTSGPVNVGSGIYDMRFSLIDDAIAGTAYLNPDEALSRTVVGPKLQAVHYNDGSVEYVPAGTYSFHPIHFHFHDDYVLSFELYAVTNLDTGGLTLAGLGTKSGFCPADQLFGDWYAFVQGYETPGGDTPLDSCFSPSDGVIGLSVGWGDVYRWQRPGMYVEFGGQPNGRYVVRSIVDAEERVLETNDGDNISYAYIEVQGDTIELLERGWGRDPWDPDKVVFSGPGPMQRDEKAGGATTVVADASDELAAEVGAGSLSWTLLTVLLALAAIPRRQQPAIPVAGADAAGAV